jgi:hypothetical protein
VLPQHRYGWEPVKQVISRLLLLPGRMAVREELAGVFARPKISWAAPPPAELATDLERAILKSANNWWCDGRWWTTGCTCILCWAQLCKRAKHSDRALLCLPCLWLVSEHMWGSWASDCCQFKEACGSPRQQQQTTACGMLQGEPGCRARGTSCQKQHELRPLSKQMRARGAMRPESVPASRL